jgi:hypothetical protein
MPEQCWFPAYVAQATLKSGMCHLCPFNGPELAPGCPCSCTRYKQTCIAMPPAPPIASLTMPLLGIYHPVLSTALLFYLLLCLSLIRFQWGFTLSLLGSTVAQGTKNKATPC